MTEHEAYERWLKPRTAQLLRAIGLDVVYHRGEGDHLWTRDAAGAEVRVLDLLGGFGASLLGHNHPRLVAALRAALDEQRPQNAQASVRGRAGRLAQRLAERVGRATGRDYVVTLASTGTEAIEAALKHAELELQRRAERRLRAVVDEIERVRVAMRAGARIRPEVAAAAAHAAGLLRAPRDVDELFAAVRGAAERAHERPPLFLAVEHAFHGKTTGALSLTHSREFREPWRRLGLRVTFLPAGDEDAIGRALAGERVTYPMLRVGDGGAIVATMEAFTNVVCALAEPIQGEGGIRELSPLYLAALRAAADEHGFPLVLDEIQCGLGRTGRFLASEGARVRGDYVTLSKALGGGLVKLAALLVERERYVRDFGWLHTSTFADDDHSAAVGLAVLDAIDADDGALLRACHDKGAHLAARLRELAARFPDELVAVRGRGLMLGIELGELPRSGSPLLRLLGAQRLLAFLASGWFLREARIRVAPTLSAHATIRLEPSAGVPVEELDRFVDALGRLLAILRQGRVDALLGAPPPPEGPRLTVVPPPPAPAPGATSERVGFLAHFLEPGDLRAWEPRLGGWSDDAIEAFLDDTLGLIEPFHLKDVRVRSATGATVDAAIVAVPFLPAQVMRAMKTGDETPLDLVRAGVALLRAHGARVVGFGGYTSIASDNCTAIATADVALTSGNSLTAAAALEALFAEAARAGIDAARARLGVVGAAGNIGAVLAEVASDRVGELVLVGRAATVPRLEEAAEALREAAAARGRALTVRVAGDLAALQGCALVVSATNAPRPVVKPEHIGDGPVIVADVAAPRDVDPTVAEARPRARVLRGGMVRLPDGQTLDLGGLPLQPGQIYGCLAETLLLGLDGAREHFSYGALRADRVRAIAELARRHGFALS